VPFSISRQGEMYEGTLGATHSIGDITIQGGTAFSFNPRYSVGLMLFRGGVVTDGKREYKSSFMQIYKHGVVGWGELHKATEIDGKTYEPGTQLSFDRDGDLIKAELHQR